MARNSRQCTLEGHRRQPREDVMWGMVGETLTERSKAPSMRAAAAELESQGAGPHVPPCQHPARPRLVTDLPDRLRQGQGLVKIQVRQIIGEDEHSDTAREWASLRPRNPLVAARGAPGSPGTSPGRQRPRPSGPTSGARRPLGAASPRSASARRPGGAALPLAPHCP